MLLYMVCFSFAYLSLDTGTGALILFAVVQLTMFSVALVCGERFTWLAWVGLSVAFAGLIVLVAPGLQAPNAKGALLMALAGLGWGWYSLLGRHNHSPLQSTASNFLFAVPVAAIVSLIFRDSLVTSSEGVIYAVLSGALASGVGYAVWYHVLPRLAASHAAVVQLFVPMLAAVGGVLFSQESITLRLVISGVVTITGVYLVLRERNRPQP
ncbi:MAG: DMT family transporter [Pseudomonadota bacterium]